MTNYTIGRWIVEEQQSGQDRAEYGSRVIDRLAQALNEEFGRGYSRESLRNARKFYLTFKNRISQTLFGKMEITPFTLPWSHYLLLMRIKDESERDFYEIEATQGAWSIRTLQRQYAPSLYERLLLILSVTNPRITEWPHAGNC